MTRALKILGMLAAIVVLGSLMFDARAWLFKFAAAHVAEKTPATAPAAPADGTHRPDAIAAPPDAPIPEDFAQAVDDILIAHKPDAARMEAICDLFARWTQRDARAALAYAENALEGDTRERVIRESVAQWAQRDLHAAADWAVGMAHDRTQATALSALVDVWGAAQPAQAAAWLSAQTANAATDRAAEALAARWAATHFESARAWAQAQIDTGALTPGGLAIVRGLARADGEQAARWAMGVAESLRAPTLAAVAESWAAQEPAQAGAFAQAAESPEAAKAVATQWALSDAAGASQWLAALPDGALRTNAVEGFARALLPYDPESALAWALSVSDADTRAPLVRDLLTAWATDDSESARDFAQAHALAPAEQP